MTVLPLLPLCRQPSPARQQILTGLRHIIRHAKQLDLTLPRIRIRSLDIIPLSLSLPRTSSLKNITNIVDSSAHATSWLSLGPDNPLANALLPHILAFYDPINRKPPPSLPPMITWNPTSLATIHTTPSLLRYMWCVKGAAESTLYYVNNTPHRNDNEQQMHSTKRKIESHLFQRHRMVVSCLHQNESKLKHDVHETHMESKLHWNIQGATAQRIWKGSHNSNQ